jgi:uncharacterized protein (TIGR02099 family)
VEFQGRLRGSLKRFADLQARLEVRADRLSLAGVADFVPPQVARPVSGAGGVAAEVHVVHGRLEQLRLDLHLTDVGLQLPRRDVPTVETVEISAPYRGPGASPLSMPLADKATIQRPAPQPMQQARYAAVAGNFRVSREADAWRFRATGVQLQRESGADAEPASVSGRWSGHPASAFALQVHASAVDVAEVWPLLLAVAPAGFDRWAGLDPSGRIEELRADVARERAGSQPVFAASAAVTRLAARPAGRWPGVSGISATFSGTEQRGRLALSAGAASFEWPRMFREAIGVQSAQAQVDWRREGSAWVFAAPVVALEDPRIAARGSVELRLEPGGGSPVLAVDATVERLDARAVRGILPVGRLKPRTIAWMDQAFLGGSATNGRLLYHGPVRRFPFRQGEGEFVASADVGDVRLSYATGFAPLSRAAGTIEFRNEGLRAVVSAGDVGGLRLGGATLVIADLKEPVLDIDATASGDLAKALAVVQGSPLGEVLGRQFMELTGSGPADYRLGLHLPTGDPGDRSYTVRTRLRGATLASPLIRAPASRVTGELEIRNLEFRADALRGQWLDGPFELQLRPGPVGGDVSASVVLSASGRAGGTRLPRVIGLPDGIRMSGTADWRLDGRLDRRGVGRWPSRFEVTSNLRGLEIEAPDPFAKPAADVRPTRVVLDFARPGRNELRVESGAARAFLVFAQGAGGRWDLERGAARFDGRPLAMPARPGLHVAGDWPEFDLAQWLALRSASPGGRRLSDWLGPVDVHLDRARVLGFELLDVTARLQPTPGALHIQVNGPMAEGRVTIPVEPGSDAALSLDMQRLQLQSAGERGGVRSGGEADPRTLPALTVRTDEFTWQGRRFGRLEAELSKDPRGLRLARLATESDAFGLSGSGTWLVEDTGTRCRLALEFSSTDLAAASVALGYRPAVDADRAWANANVTWAGGPAEDAVERMDGTLRLELDRGQLRGVSPGAGRMLGLMSVTELPRRLALDFRDVTDKGLAFDRVRGDFELRAGNAHTQNLLLEGAAVDIGVVGRTGLVTQDYDQTVIVSGNPSGPITAAGALAAGPVGAAGALLFSQLFKGQLQGLARVYYRVTGPWSNPTVVRMSGTAAGNVAAGAAPDSEVEP